MLSWYLVHFLLIILLRVWSDYKGGQDSTDQESAKPCIRRDFWIHWLQNAIGSRVAEEAQWPLCVHLQLQHVWAGSAAWWVCTIFEWDWIDQSVRALSATNVFQEDKHSRSKSKLFYNVLQFRWCFVNLIIINLF